MRSATAQSDGCAEAAPFPARVMELTEQLLLTHTATRSLELSERGLPGRWASGEEENELVEEAGLGMVLLR